MPTGAGVNHALRTWGWARPALHFPANARYRENRLLGPLWEGAPAAAGGGENFAAIRNISGYGKVLSLRPCGATSLAEGGGGGGALPRKRPIPGHPRAGHVRPLLRIFK